MLNALRVLIVEDDFIIAQDIKQRLIDLQFQPIGHTAFGEDVVQLAVELRPDLVLTDLGLAGAMDGIDVALTVRQKFNLPTIFISGSITDEVMQRVAAAPPFAFINKPMSDWDFSEVMQAWRVQTLRSKQAARQESAAAIWTVEIAAWLNVDDLLGWTLNHTTPKTDVLHRHGAVLTESDAPGALVIIQETLTGLRAAPIKQSSGS